MKASAQDRSASKRVRVELLKRGWTYHDLAQKIGYAPGTVANVMSGNDRLPNARQKIEQVLGLPIWTAPTEFIAISAATDKTERSANLSI